jgi:Domain of unknown function (DUF4249)
MKRSEYIITFILIMIFASCEKELKVNYGNVPIRQVLICNFYTGGTFQVSLSASKRPDDFSSVNFLETATVDLYEDGIYIETLPYVYRDSSTSYGFFTSVYKAVPGKTYTIRTSDAEGLPGVSATEYLPENLPLNSFWLEQYPDDSDPIRKGILSFDIDDDPLLKDQYFASVYYYVIRPKIKSNGDTVWVEEYQFSESPLSGPGYPNPSKFGRLYFTDTLFNGMNQTFVLEFPGLYNTQYKGITLIFELSHIGKNYYDYYANSVSKNSSNINAGFGEPVPEISNIENGYGHFSAQNSSYIVLRIK